MRRLPQELLADIFVYFSTPCVPQDRARLVTKSVARVCYTWRAVARGTPELWTHFSTSEHSRPSTVVDAGLVALSRGRSISIYHALPNDDERLLELLEALSPYTARWGSLALTGLKASFSRLPVAELPSLEEATLNIRLHTWPYSQAKGMLDFISRASRLRRLHVSSDDDNVFNSHTKFVLPASSRLTHLSLCMPYAIISGEILTLALPHYRISLTHLTLNLDSIEWISNTAPVHLPALRVLDLEQQGYSVLPYIIAPNLQELALRRIGWMGPFTQLLQFFRSLGTRAAAQLEPRQSNIMLRKLTLCEVAVSDPAIFQICMGLLEHLRELHIEESRSEPMVLTEDLLTQMTCKANGTFGEKPMFPSLTAIDIVARGRGLIWQDIRHALDNMLDSRREAHVYAGYVVPALQEIKTRLPGTTHR